MTQRHPTIRRVRNMPQKRRGREKPTQLENTAKLTSLNTEQIDQFHTPPWRGTPEHYQGRLMIALLPKENKLEASKAHNNK